MSCLTFQYYLRTCERDKLRSGSGGATQNLFSPPSSTFLFSEDIGNHLATYAYWIPAIDDFAYPKPKRLEPATNDYKDILLDRYHGCKNCKTGVTPDGT